MKRGRRAEFWITGPSFGWLLLWFGLPTLAVFLVSFRPADPFGGIGAGWTWATWRSLSNPNYPAIIWRTVWLSVAATALCLLLALPAGYYVARAPRRWRNRLMLLIVIPFWTNFLIRIFAWKVLLHPEGLLKQAGMALGLFTPETQLMYHAGAILLVLVYTYLPFALLPIYAAAERFDYALLEAACDLGSSRLGAFYRVFLPGIRRGLTTAALMVFIPALGSYVIPDLMGGASSEMIGNKIAQRTFVDRNLPHASALSALLSLTVLIPMILILYHRVRGSAPPALRPTETAP
ncbi:MAG: ABC transporter permease [Candidatus Marinimicrobia bacterium]|nr:ABC transporter permease [Candidatus Neomarinimicrobiota bacterium]